MPFFNGRGRIWYGIKPTGERRSLVLSRRLSGRIDDIFIDIYKDIFDRRYPLFSIIDNGQQQAETT